MISKQIELEGTEALLDIGVSVPLKTIRIPFTKKEFIFRLTMKRPRLGNQIKIARLYLEMNITYRQMKLFTKEEEMAFIALHGKKVSKMVALTICRNGLSGSILCRPLAWFLRTFVEDKYLLSANLHFISLMGTKNFMTIIRSVEEANPMKPRLSQRVKGS